MNIVESTRVYEQWLGSEVSIVKADLRRKHDLMRESPFPFFRGTFYRWAELFGELCPDLAAAPKVLAVGDLHVENFGTWRDAECRLVWGVNDFDESFTLPYSNDLVRLCTSIMLASDHEGLGIVPGRACELVLDGYSGQLAAAAASGSHKAEPFVLAEHHAWLWELAKQRRTQDFWEKLKAKLGRPAKNVPLDARAVLREIQPAGAASWTIHARTAGMGSLGKPRFCTIGLWRGGLTCREIKVMTPSACVLLKPRATGRVKYSEMIRLAIRAADPFVTQRGRWLARRLGPDCAKVELDQVRQHGDLDRLLGAMGQECANVHAGTGGAAAIRSIRADLKRRRSARWLKAAAAVMADATVKDFRGWRKSGY